VTSNIQRLMPVWQRRIDAQLQRCLSQKQVPDSLRDAMCYAVLNGGKRLRPLLAYASAAAVSGEHECADIPACSVELIHAYSLIHDDLPAMDNDVLRRGKPTCHVVYGEATAILAGDALQTLAFELLTTAEQLACGNGIRLQMLTELTRASGWQGMVAGQALDIAATGLTLDEAALSKMHVCKTGALITASVVTGALSTNIATPAQLEKLRDFANLLGLAFQIQDDILDVEAASSISGKQQGKDALRNKPTYPSILGMQVAKTRLQQCAAQAELLLQDFSARADPLRELAHFVVSRKS